MILRNKRFAASIGVIVNMLSAVAYAQTGYDCVATCNMGDLNLCIQCQQSGQQAVLDQRQQKRQADQFLYQQQMQQIDVNDRRNLQQYQMMTRPSDVNCTPNGYGGFNCRQH